MVIDDELVDAVDVGNLELPFETTLVSDGLQRQPDERVDSDEFHLDVVGPKRLPSALPELFDVNLENDVLLDGVGERRGRSFLALEMVVDGDDAEDAGLFEAPVDESGGYGAVARFRNRFALRETN